MAEDVLALSEALSKAANVTLLGGQLGVRQKRYVYIFF